MPEDVSNPFVNSDLLVPSRYHDAVQKYTLTFTGEDGKAKDVDRSPFGRYIDIWWASVAIGVREGTVSKIDEPHKFITGAIFSNNPWMVVHLQMIALAHTGDVGILRDRAGIVAIGNGYAATGLPIILEILSKKLDPIWDISNFFGQYGEIASTT